MGRVLGFASLTLLTQVVLLLQQVLLIPLQIHVWGHQMTAEWYAAIAMAALCSVADLGLRSAGHAELLKHLRDPGDTMAAERFRDIWTWIRVLVSCVTISVVAFNCCFSAFNGNRIELWPAVLIVAGGIETALIIRIIYLDSAGLYNASESGYLVFSGLRLLMSLVALTVFDIRQTGLAVIYLVSVVFAVALQGFVCRKVPALQLVKGWSSRPSFGALAIARHTIAGPCAQWVQVHLPVLILSAIASPVAVTIYVALRAIFGMARQSIQQIARAASVEYLKLRSFGRGDEAEAILSALMIFAGCLGAVLACAVMVEHRKVLETMIMATDTDFYQFVALAFGLTGSFLSSQIIINVMMRTGHVAEAARRQYGYIVFSVLAAVIALITKSPEPYLLLASVAEIASAVLFIVFPAHQRGIATTAAGRRGLPAAVISAVFVLIAWTAMSANSIPLTAALSDLGTVQGAAVVVAEAALLAAIQIVMNLDLYREIAPFATGKARF